MLVKCDLGPDVAREVGERLVPGLGARLAPLLADPGTSSVRDKVRASARWLKSNCERPISVADAAQVAAMSERNYLRRFKDEIGITPSEYLLRARLDMVCRLLIETDLPVDKIARRNGIANGDRLAKIFRKRLRVSPTEYRLRNRQGPARAGRVMMRGCGAVDGGASGGLLRRWFTGRRPGREPMTGRAKGRAKFTPVLFVAAGLALSGCTLEPGAHFSTVGMDRYGTSITGVPGASARPAATGDAGPADAARGSADTPPPGALTEITPELIKAERLAAPAAVPADVQRLFDAPKPYTIGAGDVLSIMVWDHPELNLPATSVQTVGIDYTGSASVASGYSVDSNGMIQVAYAGAVKVGGLTEMEARGVLTRLLGEYVRQPQITLRVQTYRSRRVYMDGEVRTPGLQIFNDVPMTLPEALNRAGGFTPVGDRAAIAVIRDGKSTLVNIPDLIEKGVNPSRILLRNDDIVRVYAREDSKVFVIGEVTRPATLFLRNGELSLNEALGDAGGVSQLTADGQQVYVVRNLSADTHRYST